MSQRASDHPEDAAQCPTCGFVRAELPPWARLGALFAVRGVVYRVIGEGSTNSGTPGNWHFRRYVLAARAAEPIAPLAERSTRAELENYLARMLSRDKFFAADLMTALHLV
jgi:hypothetical protein